MTARRGKRRALFGLFLCGALAFTGLGVWQLDRLAWKRDLIARVNERIHAPPVRAPGVSAWATFEPVAAEYRRVTARGVFLHDRETLVDALTELGAGSWVVTPLRTAESVILVNRGFVPPERRDPRTRAEAQPAGEIEVTGLLRLTEPAGRILRPNEPAADRWFSRDVAAIARARGLTVAPYFVDAEASPGSAGWPRGGLTMVRFRNAHLAYALTWFALAGLCVIAALALARESTRTSPGAK